MEQTRQHVMATDNVTAILFQNLDEKINSDLKNTQNDSINIWSRSLRDLRVFATREINNDCLNG